MTASDISLFEQRKRDHIELALLDRNQTQCNEVEQLQLIHEAIPDLDFDSVNISSVSFNKNFRTPFFVSSMTAGHHGAVNINARLAEASAQMGWAMGVGSQRRELIDTNAANEWQSINKSFPELELYGNIGITQVIVNPISAILKLCDHIAAKALFIHCNPLQECIQPEGTPQFAGAYDAIETICKTLSIPVIIKETGCGFSTPTLSKLMNLGIAAVDVSGFGGTHWGRIEGDRTADFKLKQTAAAFNNWGISTVQSLLNARSIPAPYELWASGGVRSGLTAAKYLALGANRIGIAKPMLEAALQSVETIIEVMQGFEYQLKTALFCTGSKDIAALRETHRWNLKI